MNFKKYIVTKLKIISFIFALIGWLLLFIFLFGQYFVHQLINLEKILKSNIFIWGLRIFIFLLVIILFKFQKEIQKILVNNKIKIILYIIFIGGAVGWSWWFFTLL